jgi:hypothetical protein
MTFDNLILVLTPKGAAILPEFYHLRVVILTFCFQLTELAWGRQAGKAR